MSRAYAFALDGRDVVVRFGAYADDFAKDAAMASHSSPSLRIPEVLEIGTCPVGPFCLSVRAGGVPLDELDEHAMRRIMPALLDALDAIRQIDVLGSQGFGIWRPGGFAPHRTWREALLAVAEDDPASRIHGWRRSLERVPAAARAFAEAFHELEGLVTRLPDIERGIVHGDLLNRNVLVEEDGLAAVLDWGNAMYGDPLYDSAWLRFWWPWYPAWAGIDIRSELDAHRAAMDRSPENVDLRMRCYLIHIGLDGLAYNAFRERWDDVHAIAARTLDVLSAP